MDGMEYRMIEWETKLALPEGERTVKSPIYQFRTHSNLSKWQIELNPRLVDSKRTRYLSFWVKLVDSEKEHVDVGFLTVLLTSPTDSDYVKAASPFSYSVGTPWHGFRKFIEMYRIESDANPRGDRFAFELYLHFYPPTPQPQFSIAVGPRSDYEAPVTLDGTLVWNGIELFVDSKRLQKYSFVLGRLMKKSPNLTLDVSSFFDTKFMAEAVIKFIHYDGVLMPCPQRPQGIRKLMKMAKDLGIPKLRTACHEQFIMNMQPKYFSEVIGLIRDRTLKEKDAMPLLMAFLNDNCHAVLQDDTDFMKTYKSNTLLFRRKYSVGSVFQGLQ